MNFMKIRINWGTGILIFIVLFFVAAFSFIYFSYQQHYDLVDKGYYPKQVEYQKQIEKMKNFEELGEELSVEKKDEFVVVSFPASHKNNIQGKIHFYRPSDASMDKEITIQTLQGNKQKIPIKLLYPGKYILKIEWSYDGKEFYQERILIF